MGRQQMIGGWGIRRWAAAFSLHGLAPGPRRFLAFLFMNVMSWMCLIGTVMVLHARALGIGRGTVGILYALLYFAGACGLLTKPLAERYGSKRLLMAGWTARYLLVLPVVFTPLAYAHWGARPAAVLLFATCAMFSITRSLAGIAWSSWLHEIVPAKQLGLFYALETMMTRALIVAFGVFCYFGLGNQPPLWRFAAVAGFGVACGLASVRLLGRIPGGEPLADESGGGTRRGSYRQLFRDRLFLGFLGSAAAFNFVYVGQGLMVALTLRDHLGLGAGLILMLTSVGSLLTLVTTQRWRRVADQHGSPVVMTANGLLVVACLAVLGWLRPGQAPMWLLALVCMLLPVAETGHYMACSRGFMLRMKSDNRQAYNAVWSAGTNVLSGVAAVCVGFWLQGGDALHFRTAAWGLALLMLAIAIVNLRLPVPEADACQGASQVYDSANPLLSMGNVLRYVLRPAPSAVTINAAESDDERAAGVGRHS